MINMNLISKSQILLGILISTLCLTSTNASLLEDKVNSLEKEGWKVGVSIFDANSKKLVSVNGDTRFPLDSTVKALACANVLANVDKKLLSLDKKVLIDKKDIVTYSPVTIKRINKNMTLREACAATTAYSDNTAANITILAQGCDVVGIDEAQFFDDEIVKICNDLANQGIRVIVAGLDMDFKGNPFGPMPALMATAEYVTKVHAVCTRTGNLANYSFRKTDNDKLVMLGETEEYEPLSRAAYYHAMRKDQEK